MRRAVFMVMAVTSLACSSTYAPPRTVPAGAYRSYVLVDTVPGNVLQQDGPPPSVRYMGRVGVAERVDLGFQVSPLSLGLDAKWNPVRGTIDVAVAPGASAYWVPNFGETDEPEVAVQGDLPLLFGWNVGERVSLLWDTGLMGVEERCIGGGANCEEQRHVFGKLGAGLNLRITHRFALEPELHLLHPLERSNLRDPILYGGIGFAFGRWSEYEEPAQ